MSTELTFEQRAARDLFVSDILNCVNFRIRRYGGELKSYDIENWKARASYYNMSEAAISQTVEEVRQVLNLMSKLNKKRVA